MEGSLLFPETRRNHSLQAATAPWRYGRRELLEAGNKSVVDTNQQHCSLRNSI